MPAAFEIRVARPDDAELLARLNATVHAQHVRERPDFFKPLRPEEVAEWFRGLLGKPTARCWIAEVDATAAGYVLMTEHRRDENVYCLARHWHEIDQIGVEAPFRGRGIGRALIQTALAAAEATGVRDVELASWSFNADAHAVFQRCGLRQRLVRFEFRPPSS